MTENKMTIVHIYADLARVHKLLADVTSRLVRIAASSITDEELAELENMVKEVVKNE